MEGVPNHELASINRAFAQSGHSISVESANYSMLLQVILDSSIIHSSFTNLPVMKPFPTKEVVH